MSSNPYSPPTPAASTGAVDCCGLPIHFGGSMSEAEGLQVQRLIKGQIRQATNDRFLTKSQLGWCGLGGLMVAASAAHCIVYDELDQLLYSGAAGVALVGSIAAAYHHRLTAGRVRSELKRRSEGVFTTVAGRVTESGMEYLMEDYPIRYQWHDFVGCRVSTDAAILYLDFPSQLNFVAASLFGSSEQWESARAIIHSNVPTLGRLPRLDARRRSPVVKHITAGIKALNRNEWQAARHEFDRVLEVRPDESQALKGRAVATSALGDPEATLSVIEDALQRGVSDVTTRQIRASALCELQRYDEAIEDLDWLLHKDARNPDWLSGRSLAYCKLERYAEAVRDATASLEVMPDEPIALNNRGYARLKLGQIDDAIADLEAAVQLAPNFERPKELLATAHEMAEGV